MKPISNLTLYHYWRSSCSWRVRWGLAIKGVKADLRHIHLLNGESESPTYLQVNPMGYVPTLEIQMAAAAGASPTVLRLTESMAILEWIEEQFPGSSLLPEDPWLRARTRQLAEIINAGTQPLQNIPPQELHSDDLEKRKAWAVHWIQNGFEVFEAWLQQIWKELPPALIPENQAQESFCLGRHLTLADLLLIPQVYNALRYDLALDAYPGVAKVYQTALRTESAQASHPDRYDPARLPQGPATQ